MQARGPRRPPPPGFQGVANVSEVEAPLRSVLSPGDWPVPFSDPGRAEFALSPAAPGAVPVSSRLASTAPEPVARGRERERAHASIRRRGRRRRLRVGRCVEGGVFTYTHQQWTAGVSSGGAGDEASHSGLDSWYGSRSDTAFGMFQFAAIGSSLADDQFSVTADVTVNATSPGYGGYDAYADCRLDFTVTETANATIHVDIGHEITQGSILSFALASANGNSYASFIPDTSILTATLVAGDCSLVGLLWIVAPNGGDFSNDSWLTISVNAVPVPGPGGFGLVGAIGALASGRRRR